MQSKIKQAAMIIRFDKSTFAIFLTVLGMVAGFVYYLMTEAAEDAIVEYKLKESKNKERIYDAHIIEAAKNEAITKHLLTEGLRNDTLKLEKLNHIENNLDTVAVAVRYLLEREKITTEMLESIQKKRPEWRQAQNTNTNGVLKTYIK